MFSCQGTNVGRRFPISTSDRCVHKTLSPESLQLSDSAGALERRSLFTKQMILLKKWMKKGICGGMGRR